MNTSTLQSAREWLIECFENQEDEILEASDAVIMREVERHYDGGLAGFLACENR